ncbi:hypothetical protein MOE20_12545 [Bacillus atrophaeus]|uniref:hypothetical protein n=1 Tax=Bacillus atrophaeus TaxID=1452 RepID=UPI00227F7AAB|nr:hypothetical protein [Bacillus atrophaeus]MCY8828491.1 hypothetical protein [Bacillus atrophaeus]MCY8925436.1 hypothetical protein [Bacillus atrophaeus]MEC0832228.1 hypothetical protein [Bacillus atrophaeus]MEC0907167.1 hypothetical protein [Bacillus atrophaeus]MEC0933208.1 hypothetical protein [Bacillus atrophaeus]
MDAKDTGTHKAPAVSEKSVQADLSVFNHAQYWCYFILSLTGEMISSNRAGKDIGEST